VRYKEPMCAVDRTSGKPRILVAMSGGVDSSVAAGILLEEGYDVVGAFMRNGVASLPGRAHRQGCCGLDDAHDARRVADRLGVPFYVLDFSDAFDELIGEFVDTYVGGRTPNPCIECNRRFKLGALLKLADRLEATSVATGHYAEIVEREGRLRVARGQDVEKDQSYVLFSLGQEALARTRLPLGGLTKREVRDKAHSLGLPVAEKPESMEICFVPTGDYRDVVKERAPHAMSPGKIVHQDGRVLGEHEGTALFTVGQRRGLPGGQQSPLYVMDIQPETGTVRVGPRDAVQVTTFDAEGLVVSGVDEGKPGTSLRGDVKIRAHHTPIPGQVTFLGGGRFRVALDRPEAAITPGQAAVVYGGDEVLLGGWITRPGEQLV